MKRMLVYVLRENMNEQAIRGNGWGASGSNKADTIVWEDEKERRRMG